MTGTHQGEEVYETIIYNLRLPRIIIGLLVGACLAASGALLQGVMKNPLADPGIIGVSAGGGLAAILTMVIFPAYSYLLPFLAFIGAFTATTFKTPLNLLKTSVDNASPSMSSHTITSFPDDCINSSNIGKIS